MDFPILSVITFFPGIVGALLFFFPEDNKEQIRWTALLASLVTLVLSVMVYFTYDVDLGGYQMVDRFAWIPAVGINYIVAVDGMSLPMVLLTGIVLTTGVLISWGIDDRPREFFALLFLLAMGVWGVFVAQDMFTLFFFYEVAVFPMYLMIAMWGWKKTREYAAMKLTLFLVVGSLFALIGALAMYAESGLGTFDMFIIQEQAVFSERFQIIWFPFVFVGFIVLAGMFPFHNWSPVGHVAAPTAVSMFHAGVLMKLGAYAALRVGVVLLPEGAKFWMPYIVIAAFINVVYGSLIAMTRKDLKYMIGYSSVSHMGLVVLGLATLNELGLTGAGLQMFSHGAMTALFFSCIGMVYDRAHTRMIPELGGVMKKLPMVGVAFIIGGLVSMGMPLFSGFVAELPIFMGAWRAGVQGPDFIANYYAWIAIISALAIVITAAYIIRAVGSVFFGEIPEKIEADLTPIRWQDRTAIVILVVSLLALGFYPAWMDTVIKTGVDSVMAVLGA